MTIEQDIQQSLAQSQATYRHDPQAALQVLREALTRITVTEHPRLYCKVKTAQAEVLRQQGDAECETILQEILLLTRRHSMRAQQADAHHVLGVIAYEKDDATQAYYHLNEALEIACAGASLESQAMVLNSLGVMFGITGELERAMRYFMDSLKLQKELNNPRGIGAAYGNIGGIYVELKNIDLAIEYSERSLRYRREANDLVGVINTYINLATCTEKKTDYEQTLKHLHAAERYARSSSSPTLPLVLVRIAETYARRGERHSAGRYINNVLKAIDLGSVKDPASTVIFYAARTLPLLDRHAEACELLGKHLTLIGTQAPLSALESMHSLMALLLRQQNRDAEAEVFAKSAGKFYTQIRDNSVVREIQNLGRRRQLINAEIFGNGGLADGNSSMSDARLPHSVNMPEAEADADKLAEMRERLEIHRRSNARGTSVLDSIRSDIKQLVTDLDKDTVSVAQSMLQKIDETLQEAPGELLSDTQFKKQFSVFVDGLHAVAPKLTPTELRVSLLVRLEFRSKEIAELLFCSSQTIGVHRKNIRRKLKLTKGINLTEYLNTVPV